MSSILDDVPDVLAALKRVTDTCSSKRADQPHDGHTYYLALRPLQERFARPYLDPMQPRCLAAAVVLAMGYNTESLEGLDHVGKGQRVDFSGDEDFALLITPRGRALLDRIQDFHDTGLTWEQVAEQIKAAS